MTLRYIRQLALPLFVSALLAAFSPALTSTASSRADYTVQDLGTLGGSNSYASSVSDDGKMVVGYSFTVRDSGQRGFIWTKAGGMKMENFGALGGTDWSDISTDGETVVGSNFVSGHYTRGFVWTKAGGIKTLGTLGGSFSDANGATVVGFSETANGQTRAFSYTNGVMKALSTLDSFAYGVSSDGQTVVGKVYFTGDDEILDFKIRAFMWTEASGMRDLGTLGGGHSAARGVSADGSTIVGYSDTTDGQVHAFRYSNGVMKDLGTLGGGDSLARSVSADGETVVGYSVTTAGDEHAFVWTVAGGMRDLGTLGGRNSYAYGVSANGKTVVGQSENADGQYHTTRWTANAEPANDR